jgi:hypothetical protein
MAIQQGGRCGKGTKWAKSYEDWSVITPNLPSILLVLLTCFGGASERKFCAEESAKAMGHYCGRRWICSHTFNFDLFG